MVSSGVFQEVMDAKLANDKYKLFRNSAILAFASMVAKTCAPGSNFGVPCTANRLETWQKNFFNNFISKLHSFNTSIEFNLILCRTASGTFADRALYVHALRNIGYGSFTDQLIQMIKNGVGDTEDNAQSLRVYIIHGFDRYKNDPKVIVAPVNVQFA